MIIGILIGALGAAAIVGTLIALMRDGYRRVPTQWSRVDPR